MPTRERRAKALGVTVENLPDKRSNRARTKRPFVAEWGPNLLPGGLSAEEKVDRGCSLHSSCLNCPRPLCRYDDATRQQQIHQETMQRARIVVMRVHALMGPDRKAGILAVMREMSLSEHQVYRALHRVRKESQVEKESTEWESPQTGTCP